MKNLNKMLVAVVGLIVIGGLSYLLKNANCLWAIILLVELVSHVDCDCDCYEEDDDEEDEKNNKK